MSNKRVSMGGKLSKKPEVWSLLPLCLCSPCFPHLVDASKASKGVVEWWLPCWGCTDVVHIPFYSHSLACFPSRESLGSLPLFSLLAPQTPRRVKASCKAVSVDGFPTGDDLATFISPSNGILRPLSQAGKLALTTPERAVWPKTAQQLPS